MPTDAYARLAPGRPFRWSLGRRHRSIAALLAWTGGLGAVVGAGGPSLAVRPASAAAGSPASAAAGSPASAAAGSPASAAGAFPSGSVTLVGHGWGHGRGMGQYGALGYALAGLSYASILAHYYGGTSVGRVGDPLVRVVMTENDGQDVAVTSSSAFGVAGRTFAAGQAARLHLTASGSYELDGSTGCAGAPWTQVAVVAAAQAVAVPADSAPNAPQSGILELCQPVADVPLRGDIVAASYHGSARTVNVLPLESYLRGVVPAEEPADWGQLGQPGPDGQSSGFQALAAQAVAARSYAMASLGQYGYADICDSGGCQVYLGMAGENPLTDLAVADTAGQVRTSAGGRVATTEYSSSTGGYTAGGTFPAVPDLGDAVCTPQVCNPNHNWTTTVPVSVIQGHWPQIGTLSSIEVTARNGLGDLGGRVYRLVLQGRSGQVSLSGDDFAAVLGLKSDWFAVIGQPSGGLGGYRVADAAGRVFGFGSAAGQVDLPAGAHRAPLVAISGPPSGRGFWLATSQGNVYNLAGSPWYGSTATRRLNLPVVGVTTTPDGRGYWLVASDGGIFTFGDARFYGSTGSLHLNRPIVGMASTPDGRGYWLVASDGGIFTFGDARFYGSTGSLHLNRPIVGMASTPDGKGYWLVASDGGIFTFGDARFYGSLPGSGIGTTVSGMLASRTGRGYLILTLGGSLYAYGDAPSLGQVPQVQPGYGGPTLGVEGIPG